MYNKIQRCRLCGNYDLKVVVDLGEHFLTGIFPKGKDMEITKGPLTLAFCRECHLLQLLHTYNLNELYGENYGYRSGLNRSMVDHLKSKVDSLLQIVTLFEGDIILDIGSNDGTTLSFYNEGHNLLVGFDPTEKFSHYYRKDIVLIKDFFSAQRFHKEIGRTKKAKIITSIAMFYDLEEPLEFMRQIETILAEDGIWHFEQSYMPFMLQANAYDTICHEHLEYYALEQIKWMTERAGLKIINVEFNDINGGSFAVTVAKQNAIYPECNRLIQEILEEEKLMGLNTLAPYQTFQENIFQHRDELLSALNQIKEEGKVIYGYGASTKGNVVLQFCGIDESLIPGIVEVNEDKFGCFTPGTYIPIISEHEVKKKLPDYYLVLPWHFRENFISREKEYLKNGGKMLFPLPKIEIV